MSDLDSERKFFDKKYQELLQSDFAGDNTDITGWPCPKVTCDGSLILTSPALWKCSSEGCFVKVRGGRKGWWKVADVCQQIACIKVLDRTFA